mgnify:CR=1 FL=1|jgi:hypothetical protein
MKVLTQKYEAVAVDYLCEFVITEMNRVQLEKSQNLKEVFKAADFKQ